MAERERRGERRGRGAGPIGLALVFAAGAAAPALMRWAAIRLQDGAPALEAGGDEGSAGLPQNARAGWLAVLGATVREFSHDQIPAVAAGATFYTLLALFPALAAFVSLYGLVADVDAARRQILALGVVLPGGAVSILDQQLTRLGRTDHGSLGLAFVSGLVISILSSNAGMKALIAGLNVAYEEPERRRFITLNLVSLGFTLAAIVFSAIAIAAVIAVPGLLRSLGLGAAAALGILRWPLLLLIVTGAFALIYRYGPSRGRTRRRRATPGAAAAAVGWMAMSMLFSWYVANFGHYNETYGSLGAVIGFMTWIWLSIIVVLLGAELNAQLEDAR